jgi:TrmH family RNA methyltransferase
MLTIESFSNTRFKFLKSLARSRTRKKEQVYAMEGRLELELAFRLGRVPKQVYFSSAYTLEDEIKDLLPHLEVEVIQLSKALFDDVSFQHVPGNFIAVMPAFENEVPSQFEVDLLPVFERVEKPGNLGAVLRTCDAFGLKEVLFVDTDVDLFNPNVIRNSRGAVFSVTAYFLSGKEARDLLRNGGFELAAAALTPQAKPYHLHKLKGKTALIFGPESTGLSDAWLKESDVQLVIPMMGQVDSLNLSVSFSVMAAHFLRKA